MPDGGGRLPGARRRGVPRSDTPRTGSQGRGAVGVAAEDGAPDRYPHASAKRRRAAEGHGRLTPYLYVLPAFVVYAVFMLYPLGRAAQYSLYEWNSVTNVVNFVGFGNYVEMFNDPELRSGFTHALVLIFFYAVLPLVIGLLLAAVLNRARVKGLGFYRTVIFAPQVIAMVVVAVAWSRLYGTDGTLNDLLQVLHIVPQGETALGNSVLALPAIGLIGTWVETGLVTILLLAGMGRIDGSLYEAARLDGAGAVREFFSITLPAVRGEIAVALTLTIVAALKTFDLIYMTTKGGPGTSTTVPSYQVYNQAFNLHEVGMASTIGVTLTVLIFLINLVVNRIADRGTEDA
jgi:raffinose/stachyose/melibiose transport system permease protein